MMRNIENRKYQLIYQIMQLDDEKLLAEIEQKFDLLNGGDKLAKAIKPIRKTPSLAEMKAKQNYQGIQKEDFLKKASELQIEEPLDQLLAMLK